MLNPQSPIPLYHQLADILLARIRSGEYSPGTRIPSEHALADEYRLGRPTVRQAIEVLVNRQFLTRRRGAGTFVREPREEVDLFSLDGTTASFRKKGLAVETKMLRPVALVDVPMDAAPNPFAGGPAFFFSRLTRVEGAAVLVEHVYLRTDLFRGIEGRDLTGQSLSEIAAERFYLRPVGGRQQFMVGRPDDEQAGQLGITRSMPLLVVRRYLHFPQAENGVYAELYCRTDKYVFSQNIGQGADPEPAPPGMTGAATESRSGKDAGRNTGRNQS